MARALGVALLLLTASLAGCMGGSEETGEPTLKNRAEVSASTGGIQGVVTDPAIQPIEEATVTLVETGEQTQTATDGSYAFSNVPPGTYTVRIEAEEFIGTEESVEVRSADIALLDVILPVRPSVDPFSQEIEFAGFLECSVATPVILVAVCAVPNFLLGNNATNDKFLFPFTIEPNPWQMVTEVRWDATQPTGERFAVIVEPNGIPNDGRTDFGADGGESPLRVNTNRTMFAQVDENLTTICEEGGSDNYCNRNFIEQGGEAWSRVFVSNTDLTGTGFPTGGAAIQQQYELFVTIFYNAPACEDYSLVEGNLCDQLEIPPSPDPANPDQGNTTSGNETG